MTRRMYDSVSVSALPAGGDLYAGYVDGYWPDAPAIHARFPGVTTVSITVTGRAGASVCDCEKGNLSVAQAAQWAADEVAAGRHPTIYANASTWPAVDEALAAHGLKRTVQVEGIVADYDGVATIPEGFVAKQFIGTPTNSPGDYDESVVADYWPGVDPAPNTGAYVPPTLSLTTAVSGFARTAQERLNLHFGASVPEDGVYAASTAAAVKNVQKLFGLPIDGVCGPETWAVLLGFPK